MANFSGTTSTDTLNAATGTIVGFTGGTLAELQDSIGDFIQGFQGSDVIVAGSGNDSIFGGSGFDTINGGNGNDTSSLPLSLPPPVRSKAT